MIGWPDSNRAIGILDRNSGKTLGGGRILIDTSASAGG
jgi:hypothetical protein